jgi:hypothetical protein
MPVFWQWQHSPSEKFFLTQRFRPIAVSEREVATRIPNFLYDEPLMVRGLAVCD